MFSVAGIATFLSFSDSVQLKSPPIIIVSSEKSWSCSCSSLKKGDLLVYVIWSIDVDV